MSSFPINPSSIFAYQLQTCPPVEGKKCLPVPLNFALESSYTLSLQNQLQILKVSQVVAIYVDNSSSTSPLSITNLITGQNITVAPYTQGFFNFLCPNPVSIMFSSNTAATPVVFLLNFEVKDYSWSTN